MKRLLLFLALLSISAAQVPTLPYSIENCPLTLSDCAGAQAAIRYAAQEWNNRTPLPLVEVEAGTGQIRIMWKGDEGICHDYPYAVATTLQKEWGSLIVICDTGFHSYTVWGGYGVAGDHPMRMRGSIYRIVRHEFGHGLGIHHAPAGEYAVMAGWLPYVSPTFTEVDRQLIAERFP